MKLLQGQDTYVDISVVDTATQAPVDLSTVIEARFAVYQEKENVLQLNTLADGQITIVGDPADGVFRTYIDRDATADLPLNRVYGELEIVVADSTFKDGQKVVKGVNVLADLINSAL